MTRKSAIALVLALTLVTLFTVAAFAHGGTRHWTADLNELNDSGVSGTAHLSWDGEELTVSIWADGLEADKPHAQHIHGNAVPSNATCPTIAADADGDGLISVGEGVPFYGPVLLGLTPFTTAPGGVINYDATFSGAALDGLGNLNTLQNRAIVIHGLTVDGAYVGSLPVACGQIAPAPNGP